MKINTVVLDYTNNELRIQFASNVDMDTVYQGIKEGKMKINTVVLDYTNNELRIQFASNVDMDTVYQGIKDQITANSEDQITANSEEMLNDNIRLLIQSNRVIEAIKLVREKTGKTLKDSKDYVDTFR